MKGKTMKTRENATGWIDADGQPIDAPAGYQMDYYFDAEGKYKGPDEHGIGLSFGPVDNHDEKGKR